MTTIIRKGSFELIECPQDPTEAWELADDLTAETGITHWVGRV